ncbi:hypothetical protein [Neptuniibacter sp.]|uniref:hypothetical protein n=1 Tax=Neptuniibacter sp. TaxID=1962643 RepID=UPI003B5CFD8D
MIKQWQHWSERWEVFSKRERGLLLLTAITVPVVLIYVLLIEKPLLSLQNTPQKIAAVEKELVHQQRLLELLQTQKVKDPNVAARAELKELRLQLEHANNKVQQVAKNLVSPQQMLTLLRSVLENEKEAALLSARSLPVQTVQLGNSSQEKEAGEPSASAMIYLHPFEVELQGNYQGIYNYLLKVEELDGVFFWDLLEYSVNDYPVAKVKIHIHTLSYEAGWLGA